eukprot:scaffold26125_cov50-Prasinocladus_malaysianus.AAC.1
MRSTSPGREATCSHPKSEENAGEQADASPSRAEADEPSQGFEYPSFQSILALRRMLDNFVHHGAGCDHCG